MAITFSDLHTESGLKSLNDFLNGKSYIFGDKLTKDDIKVYAAVLKNSGDSFPSVSQWYNCVSSHLATSFPGKAVGVSLGGKTDPAKAESPAADDGMDLFGEEKEEEKKAAEEREAAEKTAKKKESGKSSVLLDVKP
ncbi:elongation factor 1-beta 1-like isoform X2 [Hibiscus syriacus]|uniref:elongation factor 1-beta 1-like isoform X2 n=1 Tax=Hibiscus syriacus TaxID=106335 RepID=UPI00192389FF|nr:elongation factor 1-beta 1-like isoform X2 [Hibiscus syriacus]